MNPWQLLSVGLALASVMSLLLLLVPALTRPLFLRRHFFFIFYYFTTVIFLEVGPALAQLSEPPAVMFILRLPPVQMYAREYALVQAISFLAFQIPLLVSYLTTWRPRVPVTIAVRPIRGTVLAVGALVFVALFLLVTVRYDLFYLRLGSGLTVRLVDMSLPEFIILRSYQEAALFLIGVLFFAFHYSDYRSSLVLGLAFGVNLLVYGAVNLLNSRWTMVMLCVYLAGWYITTTPRDGSHLKRLGTLAASALIAVYLMTVVINVRAGWMQGTIDASVVNPFARGVTGDGQGVSRVDCVDLQARIWEGVNRDGPAWGEAWGSTIWLVRRFIDPEGFDRFRLTMQTTAKAYLMQNYLNWYLDDYFSCTATDLFGNFHAVGLLFGAVIFGLSLRYAIDAMHMPISGWHVVMGVFILTQILIFDYEAITVLLGWTRKLPVLFGILAVQPFVVRKVADAV